MPDDPRVQELLDELLDRQATPEEVCGACVELLPVVRERWRQICRMRAELEALLPAGPYGGHPTLPPEGPPLPAVAGYEVEAVLGHGGMGVVFRARHLRLNRRVALKMALAGSYAGPDERERFRREAQAVAALRHPNVVQIYDVGDTDGRPYFTMEFMEGGSLSHKLTGTPQPARQAAQLLATLAEAVQAAHQSGIVHRDLKPGNVLLTADGTPKISDFGLARRLDAEGSLTRTGAPLGTPSYMAPEQARGKALAVGPATDVYALGAILYELLTGRPPFLGETAAETVVQVIYQEPVPPSRLNAKVPRDLETVCLKCLHKDPQRRYPSAAALAEDLHRFQRSEPIMARPVGPLERGLRWTRRNPTGAALVATALALIGLALGGGLRLEWERAERRAETARQEQALETALEKAATLGEQGRWPEARTVLMSTSAPANLRERLEQARADAEMAANLEGIRLRLSADPKKAGKTADPLYAEAFRNYGIDLKPAEAAARIRHSAIRNTLVAFLHDWLYWASEANNDKLRAVLDQADDNPWRRAYREALTDRETGTMNELATAPEALDQPPLYLSGLGGILLANGQREEALAFLREAQHRNPDDFWLNYLLGHFWENERPQVAAGYFRAAVAIRPRSDEAHTVLGRTLRDTGDTDGAIAAFRKALALNPTYAVAKDLARLLAPSGRLEEVREVWEKIVERNPSDPESWYGYPQLCLYLGKEEAYRRVRKVLLERIRGTTDDWRIAERTSLTCLLLPAGEDELRRAVVLADRAMASESNPDPDNPYLQFLKGLAEYRQGRPKKAVRWLKESSVKLPNRASPRLVLAMAQFQSGSAKDARKTLAAAVSAYNWKQSQASHTTVWVSHVLRREAEAMILPNLPAFLQGAYQPQDNDERLALLGICQFQGLYAAASRLYADAFAADPHLADNLTADCRSRAAREQSFDDRIEALNTECRYLAARCAALAGCGLGKDGAKLKESERTHWRRKALEWLRADLVVWSKTLDSGRRADRDLAREMLTLWQDESDLAGLRRPSALDKLSGEERKEWLTLWREVEAFLRRTARPRKGRGEAVFSVGPQARALGPRASTSYGESAHHGCIGAAKTTANAAFCRFGALAQGHGFDFTHLVSFGLPIEPGALARYRKAARRRPAQEVENRAAANGRATNGAPLTPTPLPPQEERGRGEGASEAPDARALSDRAARRFARHVNPVLLGVAGKGGLVKTFVRGQGMKLWDADGRSYLDFVGGFGAMNLGHNLPAVARAVASALEQQAPGFAQSGVNPLAAALAEQLVEITPPGLEMVFFCNSGTEAVEAALKLARAASGWSDLLYCERSFHGKSLGSLSVTGNPALQRPFGRLLPGCQAVPFGDPVALERALRTRRFAAFVVEPIQGEDGMNVPPDGYLRQAQRLCRASGTLLIVDEVQTGLGRTGALFAVDHEGVEPDLMALAKSLGGGLMPIGAMLTRRDLWMKAYGTVQSFALHSSTFGGGSLACAAGLAALRALQEEGLVENAQARGRQLHAGLDVLISPPISMQRNDLTHFAH